jgi:F-type H+-transporting ATPase subunit delta
VAERDTLIDGYAEALVAVAQAEDEAGPVEDQLFAFSKAVERDTKLREALTDPALPAENKKALVREILGERTHPVAAGLLGMIIDQGRERELGRIVDEMVRLSAERRQHAVAEVRSAVPLDEEQRRRLEEALSRATGKTVEVKVVVDPSVVGGAVAQVGDVVFDGSVRTRLVEARRQLAGA